MLVKTTNTFIRSTQTETPLPSITEVWHEHAWHLPAHIRWGLALIYFVMHVDCIMPNHYTQYIFRCLIMLKGLLPKQKLGLVSHIKVLDGIWLFGCIFQIKFFSHWILGICDQKRSLHSVRQQYYCIVEQLDVDCNNSS